VRRIRSVFSGNLASGNAPGEGTASAALAIPARARTADAPAAALSLRNARRSIPGDNRSPS
jgi:hypothetical protein